MITKALMGLTAMAFGAAVVIAMPGFGLQAEAVASPPAAKAEQANKGDRLDVRPLGTACSQQAWPYFEITCLRDRNQAEGQAREIRRIVMDRLAAK